MLLKMKIFSHFCVSRGDYEILILQRYKYYIHLDDTYIHTHTHTHTHKHTHNTQILETELSSHEAMIQAVAGTAQELISARHFASQQIQQQREELLSSWAELKETASKRRQLLDDSLQVQQVPFYPFSGV